MKRSNILSIISFFLLVVIISPNVMRVLDYQGDFKIVKLNDEESKKEGKNNGDKEMEEEAPLSFYTSNIIYVLKEYKKNVSNSYMIKKYHHTRDILLPPPRLNV